jgi:outer membrane protein
MTMSIRLPYFLPFLLLSAISNAQLHASDSLSADQAVHLTLKNHPMIQQAQQSADAAQARVGLSRSVYYPDFFIDGVYARVGPVAEIDIQDHTFKLFPENNYDLHLGLRQILYDFGKSSTTVSAAQSNQKTAAQYVELIKYNLAYQTIGVFDAILILHHNIAVLDEQIEALNQHLEISAKKVKAGTATDYDVLTTRVRIAAAENDKIDMQNALSNQEITLRQLNGLAADQPINLIGEFDSTGMMLNPDSLLAAAQNQRLELTITHQMENSTDIQRHMASLGDRPSLMMDLTSGFKNGYEPDLNKATANFTAGLSIHVPIFNGHRTHYQYQEAEANLQAAKAHSSDVQRQIASEVKQAITGVYSSMEKIHTSEIQVAQAEEALSMANTRYDAGVITNLDLLDAQTMLSQAKLIRLRALYNYTVSMNTLNKATGKVIW